jgi:hypothetical protein
VTDKIKWDVLTAPVTDAEVNWRVDSKPYKGNVRVVPYLNARDVVRRFNDACGPDRWQKKTTLHWDGTLLLGATVAIGVHVNEEWVWKESSSDVPDYARRKARRGNRETNAREDDVRGENEVRATESRAFVRAAVDWGIGGELYECRPAWVKGTSDEFNTPLLADYIVGKYDEEPQPQSRRGAGPASGSSERVEKRMNNIHRMGRQYFSDKWDEARHEMCSYVTRGEKSSIKDLSYEELDLMQQRFKELAIAEMTELFPMIFEDKWEFAARTVLQDAFDIKIRSVDAEGLKRHKPWDLVDFVVDLRREVAYIDPDRRTPLTCIVESFVVEGHDVVIYDWWRRIPVLNAEENLSEWVDPKAIGRARDGDVLEPDLPEGVELTAEFDLLPDNSYQLTYIEPANGDAGDRAD